MSDDEFYRRLSANRFPRLLVIGLLVSLTLHVIIFAAMLLLPWWSADTPPQQPVQVQLVDAPPRLDRARAKTPPEPELDQQPTPNSEPVESPRKADRDQKVDKETAPEGTGSRDRLRAAQAAKKTNPTPRQGEITQEKPGTATPLRPSSEGDTPQSAPTGNSDAPNLTPDQLMPDPRTLSRIAQGRDPDDRNELKKRDNVEIGDTIWLNLQHDLLISFFRRFHDQVERVWNYPAEAAARGEQGTLLLKIIVDRSGELIDVDLLQSSGSDQLDYEAIQAVYRAAPFGPITSHYPHQQLNIMAYFSYQLGNKYIYGQR